MTNGPGKSDRPTVPEKSPNNAGQPAAEGMEGRGLAKGNLPQQNASRIQSRGDAPSALERVRQAAAKDKKLRFTALLHHIYNLDTLRMAYFGLKKEAAPGVDGETWRHYGEQLEVNLQDLSDRLKRGAYRARPVRRVYIPKADGRQRPLGVTTLEDKIVQRAAVEVLNAIYETDFLGFSYGFRPGRSQHQALDALYTGLLTRKVNWVLDLDIKGFFDGLSHEWLVKFIEHRVADRRVVRLIQKWLNAGVLEDGKRIRAEEGTPQGGSASPLLANVYLHYVFDLWVQAWRRKRADGDVIVVRFADDIVVGFHSKTDADQFGTHRTNEEVPLGAASREDAAAGIRSACDRPTAVAWRREAGDVQLSRLYAYLREEEEQWTVYGVAANDTQEVADETERGESRTSATDARTHPRTGQVAARGCRWSHPLLRSAHESTGAGDFSVPSGLALASRAVVAQPERPCSLGSHAAPHHPLAASAYCLSSLSSAPHGRRHLRQEPDAGNPLVRIRGGGCAQSRFLLRLHGFGSRFSLRC
jgi:retron-type reverse transcriptase